MATSEFWLILLSGVVIGMLLSMSLRWIGRKLLSGNRQKEGADAKGGEAKDSSSPARRGV